LASSTMFWTTDFSSAPTPQRLSAYVWRDLTKRMLAVTAALGKDPKKIKCCRLRKSAITKQR
jgi:hypothetical protein